MSKPPGPYGPRPPSFTPLLVICAVLIAIYAGVTLFPYLKRTINTEDCIGTGRTDCVAHQP
jgi:hypothetical protein